ncbi:MAG: prealbumin-like fold domain-containing protein [Clostridiales Family XIII bacterium]|nr:prealbumin-like fold domain-containing protein [Clostridiales Family XIII bacterium]
MKKIDIIAKRKALAAAMAGLLCFLVFAPAAPAANAGEEATPATGGVYAERAEDGVAEEVLPECALLPDGSANPAFVGADGKLATVSMAAFAEIVAAWENPAANTEGMPAPDPGRREIAALAVDYPYFFHIAGQADPYGSGHSYRQYYVPAGSDIPQLAFCLEMGKNAPPAGVKTVYTESAPPSWSTAFATYAPQILISNGIDTGTDNAYRQWAMQDAVWALTGSNIGTAGNAPVIKQLVAAAGNSATQSVPSFCGVSDGAVMQANAYNGRFVRYGPFSISGMSGAAELKIRTDNGPPPAGAYLGNAAGNPMDAQAVPGDTDLYLYVPRDAYTDRRLYFSVSAPYVLPSTMSAFDPPSAGYQKQIVMTNWMPRSGFVTLGASLGGFGEGQITKLDAGWQGDYREMDYDKNGQGDTYRLAGAAFKIMEWDGSGWRDTNVSVDYDPGTRTYKTGLLAETASNGGRCKIVETAVPYGYRASVEIELNIASKYGLVPDSRPGGTWEDLNETAAGENSDGDGAWYAQNALLNVKIELQKRDKAESAPGFADPALPQGCATFAGAYYGLFYQESITDPSGLAHTAGDIVCIGITDENGKIAFDNSCAPCASANARLIWGNSDTATNHGTEDFPIYLPVFETQDRRIYPAKYYIQELAPSEGYLLDIDPGTAALDENGVPIPGTGTARKYEVDAHDGGTAGNPAGIRIGQAVAEQVKMRGFLLRKFKGNGNESELLNLNGAGFSVYLADDLVGIIEEAARRDPSVAVPQRGAGGWDKQDFIDFFFEADYESGGSPGTGKDWYDHSGDVWKGRYNFGLYPGLKRATIDFKESPVFYSGAPLIPGLRYGKYGNAAAPQDGEVVFPEFPYGEYIVFETYVPDGVERVKPFVVNIAEDGGDILDGDGEADKGRPEQNWRLQFDSDEFSVRLWKKDAETGKTIIGKDAAFRLKYLGADGAEGGGDDQWVEMARPGQNGTEHWGTAGNPFRVGADGVLALPKKLKSGAYKLYETEAPAGYVLSYHEGVDDDGYYQAENGQAHKHGYGGDGGAGGANYIKGHYILYTPATELGDDGNDPAADLPGIERSPQPDVGIVFDIDEAHRSDDFDIDGDGYDDFVIELVQYNEQQKGHLNIHKERELPPGEGEAESRACPMEGVTFELYAAEDICSLDGHGSVLFEKGKRVGSAVTDAEGNAYFKDLYLGKYILKEADVPDASKTTINGELLPGYGFVDQIVVDLAAPGSGATEGSPFYQENPVIEASWSMLDTWQLGRVDIHKTGEALPPADGDPEAGAAYEEAPLGGVKFDVIADGDITGVNDGKTVWKKGEVAGVVVTDENGDGCLGDLLPGKYILRETDAPDGYLLMKDMPFEVARRTHADPFVWFKWDIANSCRKVSAEVDKDTIKRTAAAFVSLPGQAGFNNVGGEEERYRYDVDFRSTANTWADEFVVDDPLENAVNGKVIVEELWTPVVWGDYDGRWNLWYATNKTDSGKVYSAVSAMAANPDNPGNPDRTPAYPNTGLKLLAKDLKADGRYHFTLADFGLGKGEYLTRLRFEYGRVKMGFTSKNYADVSLNGEHRVVSGADLKLPSPLSGELDLVDPGAFAEYAASYAGAGEEGGYVTGIKGDVVDWTPKEGTPFYADGAVNPGYALKPASYLVSAAAPMDDIDIVSSVSARIARDLILRDYDQDAVVTRELATFEYQGNVPQAGAIGHSAQTGDEFPLLMLMLTVLLASIALLALARITIDRRMRQNAHRQNDAL